MEGKREKEREATRRFVSAMTRLLLFPLFNGARECATPPERMIVFGVGMERVEGDVHAFPLTALFVSSFLLLFGDAFVRFFFKAKTGKLHEGKVKETKSE